MGSEVCPEAPTVGRIAICGCLDRTNAVLMDSKGEETSWTRAFRIQGQKGSRRKRTNSGVINGHSQCLCWTQREVHQKEGSSIWATRLPDKSERGTP